jgi:hypothetical protein
VDSLTESDDQDLLRHDILGTRRSLPPSWLMGRPGALQNPWDAALLTGVAAGLYSTAVLGAFTIVWTHGSILGVIAGVGLVGISAVAGAHLAIGPGERSTLD